MAVLLGGAIATMLAVYAQPLAITTIHLYQHAAAPVANRLGLSCRFTPTCSRYAEAAIARDGIVRGGLKTVRRIARCNPWTTAGTVDEP